MVVLFLVAAQLGPGKMVNAFMPIGTMVPVRTSLGKMVGATEALNKMLPLDVRAYFLHSEAKLVSTSLSSLPFTFLFGLASLRRGLALHGKVLFFLHW